MKVQSYAGGAWQVGEGGGTALVDPAFGREIARVSSAGIDFGAALTFARTSGSPALQAMTYADRALLLGRIAEVLAAHRDDYFAIALENSGSPSVDASIDIDGAIFTLKHFAKIGAPLGASRYLLDGGMLRLGKDESFQAQHLWRPCRGVAVLINAYNFPAWGLWAKAAPALLSGVPVLAKPATATCWLAQRMVEDVIKADVLPPGALSIVCGDAGALLDALGPEDLLSFTGSAKTARLLRSHVNVLRNSLRVNVEADSLNSALLGPDSVVGSAEFDLFVKEVVREMTVKAGQKCTAIRRILVPSGQADAVAEALTARLARVVVGDPRETGVWMGPLVNAAQRDDALQGIERLKREAEVIYDGGPDFAPLGGDPNRGAFVAPTLLRCERPLQAQRVHDVEVFGPVATLMPYGAFDEALALARRGQGSLVASVFSADENLLARAAVELADSHGRVLVVNPTVGGTHTGHGNVMPMCLHGGPGRAGGGEELGGLRSLAFYHRRAAIQGPVSVLDALARHAAPLTL